MAVEASSERAEGREKHLMEKLKKLSEAFEAQTGKMEGWARMIQGFEKRVKGVEDSLRKLRSLLLLPLASCLNSFLCSRPPPATPPQAPLRSQPTFTPPSLLLPLAAPITSKPSPLTTPPPPTHPSKATLLLDLAQPAAPSYPPCRARVLRLSLPRAFPSRLAPPPEQAEPPPHLSSLFPPQQPPPGRPRSSPPLGRGRSAACSTTARRNTKMER